MKRVKISDCEKKVVSKFFLIYKRARFSNILEQNNVFCKGSKKFFKMSSSSKDDFTNKKVIEIVEHILSNLNYYEREIIENVYLSNKNAKWWMKYYTRSTFFRYKKSAISTILFFLVGLVSFEAL